MTSSPMLCIRVARLIPYRKIRLRSKICIAWCALFMLALCLINHNTGLGMLIPDVQIPDGVNYAQYPLFEPYVTTDLNSNDDDEPKIERIIHQTWKSQQIPSDFVDNVKSFAENNPNWKYYLWTDESARKLIADFYPQLLDVWDGTSYSRYPIRRADALRYVVLYHYGGIYADLDVVNYRPLDNAITKHPCVFTPEPYEHSVIRLFSPYLLSNAVMLCTSGHPFLKRLIDNLHTTEFYKDSVDSTGPGYVTTHYKLYNNIGQEHDVDKRSIYRNIADSSPFFYKGNAHPLSSNTSVYIANTRYFIYSLDEQIFERILRECSSWSTLDYLHRQVCVNAKVLGLQRGKHQFAFTRHQWYMTWINWKDSLINTFTEDWKSVHILDIVPKCEIYREYNGIA